ncbi:uncharacterized protein LOC111207467 [Brassica napus]|uniref:uncharacterized protein LOC111207467 n=1 Tax=Brassica napus TaxID=3708 RepID=UPI0004EE8FA3|nr:uncharacterized protein LOC111207467 [Brassica napus]
MYEPQGAGSKGAFHKPSKDLEIGGKGFGKFQFDFKTEEDIDAVLKLQPYHFDYWMLALARWQPKQSKVFPSEIPFWVRIIGVPLEFRTWPTFESIGEAIGRTVAVDLDHTRILVEIDAFKELCFETTVDFKGGEFYDGEEVAVSLRYEKLFGYCKLCGSLCHKDEICPLEMKNSKKSPERKREGREGNKGWSDGAKHDDRARSYKGVVINGNTGQQNKERDGRDYYGKGKGKMAEAPDSKWVKVAEKGHKRPSNYHGSYRGESEASRSKAGRREDGRNGPLDVGSGAQDVLTRVASGQLRAYQAPSVTHMEAREEGEIKITEED